MGARTHIMDAQKFLEQKDRVVFWVQPLSPSEAFILTKTSAGERTLPFPANLRAASTSTNWLKTHEKIQLNPTRRSASWEVLEDKDSD